ncbi:ATP synthase protein I [Spinactinospora alkalitolerans]|uniref:ATP synthase protein I n=1 Tax=Spinactinospora alkalitolerans TaxID=687207 RepID=A0A852U6C4_9ACTN|nr:hypothetical protein [Spinactinospora alkalitolerans]NYE49460.1 ATP synthase protein I [Spinactinospora alkalitolerans]
MQEHDARILLGAAIPTAVVGVIAAVAAFALKGSDGLIGAIVGTLLVIAFFAVSALVLAWVGKKWPELVLMASLATYTIKVVALGIVLVLFGGTTAFDGTAFALTAAACVVTWLIGHSVGSMKVRRLYVEPATDDERAEERT